MWSFGLPIVFLPSWCDSKHLKTYINIGCWCGWMFRVSLLSRTVFLLSWCFFVSWIRVCVALCWLVGCWLVGWLVCCGGWLVWVGGCPYTCLHLVVFFLDIYYCYCISAFVVGVVDVSALLCSCCFVTRPAPLGWPAYGHCVGLSWRRFVIWFSLSPSQLMS